MRVLISHQDAKTPRSHPSWIYRDGARKSARAQPHDIPLDPNHLACFPDYIIFDNHIDPDASLSYTDQWELNCGEDNPMMQAS